MKLTVAQQKCARQKRFDKSVKRLKRARQKRAVSCALKRNACS